MTYKGIYWTLFVLGMIVPFGYMMAQSHEAAHAEICKLYYGNVTDFKIGWFGDGSVQCDNIIDGHFDSYTESQSQVESFGYQLRVVMFVMMFLTWALGFIYLWHQETW